MVVPGYGFDWALEQESCRIIFRHGQSNFWLVNKHLVNNLGVVPYF